MSLTDFYALARDGAYHPDEEAGRVLGALVVLAEDRRPIDRDALERDLSTLLLDEPTAGDWCTEVRAMADADNPDARALAIACASLVAHRDDLRPDQWAHLVGCLGSVWWLLERLEPLLMGLTPVG